MNKFSIINEDMSLGKFSINDKEFKQYMNLINSILKNDMYKDNLETIDTITLIKGTPYEIKQGREFSILNKVNTNRTLMTNLIKKFGILDFNELLEFVKMHKEDLFKNDGKFFSIVWETIRSTETIGEKNEDLVVDYIKALVKSKYNIDITPLREITASRNDLIFGIDIIFNVNGKECTCQVKPLKSYIDSGENVLVTSGGRLKNYNVDYIAFSNYYTNKVIMFRNKDLKINGDIITIPKKNMVII